MDFMVVTRQGRRGVLVAVLLMLLAPAMAHAASTARPLRAVLIGDSYSAGNGAGNYYGPTGCYRSSSNWAERYLATLHGRYNVVFSNRACSGSVISDLRSTRKMDDRDVSVVLPGEVDADDPVARSAAEGTGRCASAYRDDEVYALHDPIAVPRSGFTEIHFVCTRSWTRARTS